MHMFCKLVTTGAILLASVTHSLYSQPYDDMQDYDYEDSAYMQSSHSAHWSAYVPIAALIAAGIVWGMADTKHKSISSHASSRGGLGPLESSSYYSGSNYSGSGYSH